MPRRLMIKVCGMRNKQNIMEVAQTGIDFMGFIFYEKSKRFVGNEFDSIIPQRIKPGTKTVGVFVNEDVEKVLRFTRRYSLDYVQLHGNESVEYCKNMQAEGLKVIKAFGVSEGFDFELLKAYEPYVELFLFDTKSVNYGGTGQKFNWEMLDAYTLAKPFMLSGGIGPLDSKEVINFNHPQLYGIDLNSKFERSPALKDTEILRAFKKVVGSKKL